MSSIIDNIYATWFQQAEDQAVSNASNKIREAKAIAQKEIDDQASFAQNRINQSELDFANQVLKSSDELNKYAQNLQPYQIVQKNGVPISLIVLGFIIYYIWGKK